MRVTARTRARRGLASLAAVLAAAAGVAIVHVPLAQGAFRATLTNSNNTAATATYFTCRAAALGETATKAYFAYALNEAAGTTAADATGNARTGTYTAAGVTYQVASTICPRDTTNQAITLNGTSGYLSGPNSTQNNPTVFSEEIWFKTSVAGGKLIGFGDLRTGTSTNVDRHLYIDSGGKLEFGVRPSMMRTTIISPATVTDGAWHYAAATLSAAGMVLYLDGAQAASDTATTTARSYAGYWRIGYDNLTGWPNVPTTSFFTGSLAWPAVYTYALSATQILQHYQAGLR